MTLTLAPTTSPPKSSPLAALMAAVRPEHRSDLLTPQAGLEVATVGHRGVGRVPDQPAGGEPQERVVGARAG